MPHSRRPPQVYQVPARGSCTFINEGKKQSSRPHALLRLGQAGQPQPRLAMSLWGRGVSGWLCNRLLTINLPHGESIRSA